MSCVLVISNSIQNFTYVDDCELFQSENYVIKSDIKDVLLSNYEKIIFVGQYIPVSSTYKGIIYWLLSSESDLDISLLEKGYYDQVDHFFINLSSQGVYGFLENRYGKEYIHHQNDIHEEYEKRNLYPVYLSKEEKNNIISDICKKVAKLVSLRTQNNNYSRLMNGDILQNIFNRNHNKENFTNLIKKHIMFEMSGDPQEPYQSGLLDDINTLPFYIFLDKVITVYYQKYKIKTHPNISLINVNFQNVHRSGWDYIVKKMTSLKSDKQIIIDTYVDKTFGWSCDFYKQENILPYTQSWVGFIHHTFYDYGLYNLNTMSKNPLFIKSLSTCKGLFVFTEKLKSDILGFFEKYDIIIPPIFVISHPTELDVPKFEMKKFITSKNKKLVQIGGWLRNLFGIYRLDIDQQSEIKKAILSTDVDLLNFRMSLSFPSDPSKICGIDFDKCLMEGLNDYLFEKLSEVSVINKLDDKDYDDLLTSNIVFLSLKDASAVNTLIECITRYTPILINRLDPVVEFLGPDYPFYYTSFYEASKKATDIFMIQQAHDYLKAKDLTQYKIEIFLEKLQNILV